MRTFSAKLSCSLVFVILFVTSFSVCSARAAPQTIYVDDDNVTGPWVGTLSHPFQNISSGLSHASVGDALFVFNGTYYEHLTISKSLSLTGESKQGTIVDGTSTGTVVNIQAHNVSLRHFTIRNSGFFHSTLCGINVESARNIDIRQNIIGFNHKGILCTNSSNSILANNVFSNCIEAVNLVNSDNLGIVGNAIIDNGFGVILSNSNNATIFHNNFIDNTSPVNSSIDSRNSWDNGEEGNYWSTYEGSDSNHDGVGDEPRTIDASNRDNYPLMGRFFDFAVAFDSYHRHISIISNSSITVPRFNESITMLAFNVTSTISDGSFCRITIPHLLIPRPHTVLVEHEKANATTLPMSNATHSSLYFACRSNGMVRIFPKPYYDLLEEYTRLLAEHTQLQADFADLNATYTNLNQTYTQLNLLYANLQLNHTQLQADFDELNTTFHTLNQTYTQLSSSYASLQVDFHTLNSTYEKTKANYTQMYNRYRSLNSTYNQMQSEYADTRLTLSIVTIAAFALVITPSLFGARYYVRSKNQAKLIETYRKRLDELSAGHLDAAQDLFEADVMRRGSKIEEFEEKYGITVRPHDTLEDIIGSLELKKKED